MYTQKVGLWSEEREIQAKFSMLFGKNNFKKLGAIGVANKDAGDILDCVTTFNVSSLSLPCRN